MNEFGGIKTAAERLMPQNDHGDTPLQTPKALLLAISTLFASGD